jgi:hypothetical protein
MAYKYQKGLFNMTGALSGSSTAVFASSISSSGQLAMTGAIHTAGIFYGNGSGLTNISSDSVDVDDSDANSEFRLVGVAASGDGVTLVCMDTAADLITMNASTGKLTLAGPGIAIGSADITEAEFEFLDGASAGVGVASKALVLDASLDIASGLRSLTGSGDIRFVNGHYSTAVYAGTSVSASTSFIIGNADLNEADMEKLDGITNGTAAASKAVVLDGSKNIATLGTVGCGAITSAGASTLGSISSVGAVTSTAAITAGTSFIIGSADLDETDMEKLDGITNGTAAAAKAVVLDGSKNIATLGTVGCGAITSTGASTMGSLNVGGTLACDTSFTIDAVVLDATELGFLDGVAVGVGAASKALVLDAGADIDSGLRSLTGSGDVFFANGHYTGGIFTAGSDTIGSDGQDNLTVNSVAAFQNGWQLNITASGGNMNLTDAGALIILCTGSSAQTVTLQDTQVPQDGYAITVKNASSTARDITITGSAGGNPYGPYTIDGQTSLVLSSPYAAVNLVWSADAGGFSVY